LINVDSFRTCFRRELQIIEHTDNLELTQDGFTCWA